MQSSTRTWKIQPLNMVIVEILEKKSSLTDVELLEALKSIYKDLSINELNKTLMRMEITGLISVSSLTKGRRLVQLTKK